MVRELEVNASGVNVQLGVENGAAHGRALNVPAGTALAPRRVPGRLAGLGHFPESKVGGVDLFGAFLVGQVSFAFGQSFLVTESLGHQFGVVVVF